MSLKNKLIRLGSKNPDLQKHLRPVLDRISQKEEESVSFDDVKSSIRAILENEGRIRSKEETGGDAFYVLVPRNGDESVVVNIEDWDYVEDGITFSYSVRLEDFEGNTQSVGGTEGRYEPYQGLQGRFKSDIKQAVEWSRRYDPEHEMGAPYN